LVKDKGRLKKMNVLLLGGHGFVGQWIPPLAKEKGYSLTIRSRRDGLDLTNLTLVEDALARLSPEVIINCAAHVGSVHYVSKYAATVVDENMRMILNIYRAAQKVIPKVKIINPISNCSYPGESDIQVESEWFNGPVHKSVYSYGNPRRMIGVISECYAMEHQINTVNYIFPNSYGPGDYTDTQKTHALNGMIMRMIQAKWKKDALFEIWGTGRPEREWIFVKDIARMLVHGVEGDNQMITPINIAQNKAYAIRETAELIKDAVGFKGELVYNTQYQDGAFRKILDDQVFRKKYPAFKFTDIREGIKETVAYYEKVLGE
jgi:GDP-L-fucose synthase